jgi:hypothetical protein
MISYDVICRHMTSYDGKLRHLQHLGVSTVYGRFINFKEDQKKIF